MNYVWVVVVGVVVVAAVQLPGVDGGVTCGSDCDDDKDCTSDFTNPVPSVCREYAAPFAESGVGRTQTVKPVARTHAQYVTKNAYVPTHYRTAVHSAEAATMRVDTMALDPAAASMEHAANAARTIGKGA
eukprot:CAMPEP_0119136358 /NCGR_PEP_ID=MMETSP1310-20130426/21247_1 /TAXON_ID=464262 /ORGANISM="Genus nov. species nov., Strain RCC2339" /LENGTH=129 /DNA_ID=CAMNT_0007127341 /DNA_START=218 /DNA_END=608 /DNA_ORIENTATION=-